FRRVLFRSTLSLPAHACPLSSRASFAATVDPERGLVITERTGIEPMMHMSSAGTSLPGATGLHGTRYECPVIFSPSCTRSRTRIRFTHLPLTEAGQPAQTMRTGLPCIRGSGSPLIPPASNDSFSSALAIGTPREMGGFDGSPERCTSAPSYATYTASSPTPQCRSTSARRTPVHSGHPTAPVVHWLPLAGG